LPKPLQALEIKQGMGPGIVVENNLDMLDIGQGVLQERRLNTAGEVSDEVTSRATRGSRTASL
jgi:hypothetical protein